MFENAPNKKTGPEGEERLTRRELFKNALRTGLGIATGATGAAAVTIGGTAGVKKGAEAFTKALQKALEEKAREEDEEHGKTLFPDVHKT
jgi:hypothetical protein